MVYLTDVHLETPPLDAEKIIYLAACSYTDYFDDNPPVDLFPYWTTVIGEDVQLWATDTSMYNSLNWRLITNDPAKYTTLVSAFRFVNKEGEPFYPNDPFYISREDSIQSFDSVEDIQEDLVIEPGLSV